MSCIARVAGGGRAPALGAALAVVLILTAAGCGASRGAEGAAGLCSLWKSVAASATASRGLVTVSAGGDVNFGDGVTPSLEEGGLDYPFGNVCRAFASTDLSFANLECCIASCGTPVAGKEYTFRGPADSAGALKQGNIKVVSLANNHFMDYGTDAFMETMSHLRENGIAWCGSGANASEAYAPAILDVNGTRVAFLAFNGIVPDGWAAAAGTPGCAVSWDTRRVASSIKAARPGAEIVVASFHWGIELATSPSSEQKNLAHLAVDSGADLVLGHHPHVVQGFELYRNRLIAYSLGNFVFSPPRAESARSVMLITLLGPGGLVQARIVPAAIQGCRPRILDGQAATAWAGTIGAYSAALGTTVTVTGGRGFVQGGAPERFK